MLLLICSNVAFCKKIKKGIDTKTSSWYNKIKLKFRRIFYGNMGKRCGVLSNIPHKFF